MQISSPVFQNNSMLPKDYSCDGANVNPPLVFSDVPKEAKSLAFIVDDPDAPIGNFVHWVVYNIPPTALGVDENSVPQGSTQGNSGIGKPGFIGACPPNGQHRYFFKLYALDIPLVGENLDKKGLESAMEGHILATAELVGLYKRS